MTSLGANVDETVNTGIRPYVFKVSGQIYHCVGRLFLTEGSYGSQTYSSTAEDASQPAPQKMSQQTRPIPSSTASAAGAGTSQSAVAATPTTAAHQASGSQMRQPVPFCSISGSHTMTETSNSNCNLFMQPAQNTKRKWHTVACCYHRCARTNTTSFKGCSCE